MSGPLPGDEAWREDSQLMAALAQLNDQLGRHVLRYFDADAWQAELISPDEEHQLGMRLVELGNALQARAARRRALIVDSSSPQRPAIEPGAESDNGP